MSHMETKHLRPFLLKAQQEIIDAVALDYSVTIETVSEPKLPSMLIKHNGKAVLKIYPMKDNRYRILDIVQTRRVGRRSYSYVVAERLVSYTVSSLGYHKTYNFAYR